MTMCLTLRQDVHRIVHLDVHMVANLGQLVPFRGNDSTVPALDLVGRPSVLSEATGDDDAITVYLVVISFIALILQDKGHFGDAVE